MELALAGIPGAADGSMTAREFNRWQYYFAKHRSPMRRLQLQLALIAFRLAVFERRAVSMFTGEASGETITLQDFLFDPADENEPDDDEDYDDDEEGDE